MKRARRRQRRARSSLTISGADSPRPARLAKLAAYRQPGLACARSHQVRESKMRADKLAPGRLAVVIALLLAGSGAIRAQNTHAPPDPSERAPLAIAAEGSFYVGGHYDPDHPAHHIVGQVYVDYRIPQDRRHPFPIVLVHGGNQSGSGWFSTPDGRPGWAPYFLRQGYAVYVVDQVARGRSGFVPEVYGTTAAQPLQYVLEKFTSQERYKLWPQASLHTQWPGTGEPGDPAFDQYWSSDVPGMFNRTPQAQM